MALEQAADQLGEPGVEQVRGRDVDRHSHRPAACRHAAHWASAASSTNAVSSRISPASSASGRNFSGGTQPQARVRPAQQRLDGRDLSRCAGPAAAGSAARTGARVHRRPQLLDQQQPVTVAVQVLVVERERLSPSFARYMATSAHAQSSLARWHRSGASAMPMLAPMRTLTISSSNGSRRHGRDPLGDRRRVARVGVQQHDSELVAADAARARRRSAGTPAAAAPSCWSSSSPARCPNESLISLNLFRSTNRNARRRAPSRVRPARRRRRPARRSGSGGSTGRSGHR